MLGGGETSKSCHVRHLIHAKGRHASDGKQAPTDLAEGAIFDSRRCMASRVSRTDLQFAGGSGDGGIDGVISLDRLGA